MSEKNDVVKDLERQLAEESRYNALRKETQRNKTLIDHKRSRAELDRQEQDEQDLEIFYNANFGIQSKEQIAAVAKDMEDYMKAAKHKLQFLMQTIAGALGFEDIPFFRKNLIFIGGRTGDGKSTAVANIAYNMLRQPNPLTGESCKVLVLTNEERKEDVYNRLTCLHNGWSYINHNKFTDEQVKTFSKAMPALASRVTVIDDMHEGGQGATTTVEGIEAIFENLIRNNIHYDVIIIDYYQNIITSKRNPKLNEYEVQARLCRILDKYKNIYPAPIVLFGQVNAPDENQLPIFYWRIQGRKLIMTVATVAIEMVVDKKHKTTKWFIWKSRFAESIGEHIPTGFENGKFVPYTKEFRDKIQSKLDRQKLDEFDMVNGIKDVFKKEEK